MPLPTSGALSLNAIHVEASGTSGTTCSLNDTDIRGLTPGSGKTINSTLGTTIDFDDFYGAGSIVQHTATINPSSQTYIKVLYQGYLASPSPNFVLSPMGTLTTNTFGSFTINGITTLNNVTQTNLTVYTNITSSSQFTSFTYPTQTGTITVPSTDFTYNTGNLNVNISGGGIGFTIFSGTVTLTI